MTRKAWDEAKMVRSVSAKGFGFVRAAGIETCVHCSAVSGDLNLLVNANIVVQLEWDVPRGDDKFRLVKARRLEEHEAILAKDRAHRVAQDAAEAAQRTKQAMEVADDAERDVARR